MRSFYVAVVLLLASALPAAAQNAACNTLSLTVGCYVYPQAVLAVPQTLPNGSVSAPAIAWQNAPSTGLFYNPTTQGIDVTIANSLKGEINSNGLNMQVGGRTPNPGTFTILTGTAEFRPPVWTNISRPGSPVVGELGYDTSFPAFEYWTGSTWVQVAANNGSIHGASLLSWGSAVPVTAGNYIVLNSFPWNSGTVNSVTASVGAGGQSYTINLKINGTSVTGCSAIVVTSPTPVTTTCTSPNLLALGGILSATISDLAGAPNYSAAQINYTHSEP